MHRQVLTATQLPAQDLKVAPQQPVEEVLAFWRLLQRAVGFFLARGPRRPASLEPADEGPSSGTTVPLGRHSL